MSEAGISKERHQVIILCRRTEVVEEDRVDK